VAVVLFWAGIVLLAIGFASTRLWRSIPLEPTLLLGALAVGSVVAAGVVCKLVRCRFATAVLAMWVIALAFFGGLASSLAVLLIVITAMAVGSCVVPTGSRGRAALSVLVGIALMVGVVGWTLPFEAGYLRAIYVVVSVGVIAWRSFDVAGMLRSAPPAWSSAVAAAPFSAGIAMVCAGVASTCAWLPTMQYDDLATHLALPSQLAHLGYYQMNVGSDVWAVTAWASDVLQGIAWVIAGAESRGVVDTLWLVLSGVLLWRLCEQLELKSSIRWLAVALLASAPVVALTLASMQTEGPTIAVMLGLALLIQQSRASKPRELLIAAILFALLLGIKISNLWFALPLAVWCLWRWRARLSWKTVPIALLLAALVVGSSYVYAYVLTGNPVLPLFNGIFDSSYYSSTDVFDKRWLSGFGWKIVWRAVFHSSTLADNGNGALPLAMIGLSGCFMVALLRPRSRALALVGAASFLLPLSVIQYLRYATPGVALLIPAMLCGLPATSRGAGHGKIQTVFLWALPLVTLAFITNVWWQFKSDALQTLLTHGNDAVLAQFAPTRLVAQVVRSRYGSEARLLMLDHTQPFAAEFDGRAFVDSWYDPKLLSLLNQARNADSPSAWMQIFSLTGANLVLTTSDHVTSGVQTAIDDSNGSLVYTTAAHNGISALNLWQLGDGTAGTVKSDVDHGLTVSFDTSTAPLQQTLVNGEIVLGCDPHLVADGHIVVGWNLLDAAGRRHQHYAWAPCLPDGRARSAWDVSVRHRVTELTVRVQPDPAADMGLHVLSSRSSLRNDLTAQRNLSERIRAAVQFWR
jgi:hypothetical protein